MQQDKSGFTRHGARFRPQSLEEPHHPAPASTLPGLPPRNPTTSHVPAEDYNPSARSTPAQVLPTDLPRARIPSDWASSCKDTPHYGTPHPASSSHGLDEDDLARLRAPLSPEATSILSQGMATEAAKITERLRELPPNCGLDDTCREAAERLLGQMTDLYEEKAV